MKSILFFTHNIFNEENREGYRIHQYFPYLKERGYDITLLTSRERFAAVLRQAGSVDVVYLQRMLLNPLKFMALRRRAKRLVYDFDDAAMYGSKGESPTRLNRFARTVGGADAILCGNRFLFGEAAKHRGTDDGIHYVPSVVDPDEYPVKAEPREDPFMIGWIGSSSTSRYLNDVGELFRSYSGDRGLRTRMGRAARTFVEERYSLKVWGPRVAHIIDNL